MNENLWHKVVIAAGVIASIAADAKSVPFIPAEYQPIIAAIGAIAAAIAALYHPVPEKKADAGLQVPK